MTAKKTPQRRTSVQKTAETPQLDDFYGYLSIATIAKRTGLDRAVVKKRLDANNVKPVSEQEKLKIYHFDEALEALLLESDTKYTEARTRQAMAAAEEKELKVAVLQGKVVDIGEAVEAVNLIFGGLFKEHMRMSQRVAARLAKCKTPAEVTALLKFEINKVFENMRDNHAEFLQQTAKVRAA